MGIEPGGWVLDWEGFPKGLGQEGPQVSLPSWWESVPTLTAMPVLVNALGVIKQPLPHHRRELLSDKSYQSLLPTVLRGPDFPATGTAQHWQARGRHGAGTWQACGRHSLNEWPCATCKLPRMWKPQKHQTGKAIVESSQAMFLFTWSCEWATVVSKGKINKSGYCAEFIGEVKLTSRPPVPSLHGK